MVILQSYSEDEEYISLKSRALDLPRDLQCIVVSTVISLHYYTATAHLPQKVHNRPSLRQDWCTGDPEKRLHASWRQQLFSALTQENPLQGCGNGFNDTKNPESLRRGTDRSTQNILTPPSCKNQSQTSPQL